MKEEEYDVESTLYLTFTYVTVRPGVFGVAMMAGGFWTIRCGLLGTVFRVVKVKHVTYVTEKTGRSTALCWSTERSIRW